jgi:Ca2+-binding RTX toxin-like protein
MKAATILGTMAACACLGAMSNGFASGGDDILIGGQTTFDTIRYDPNANLLAVAGGRGDDRIEVVLTADGSVLLNGIPLAKLGICLERIPVVALHGGGGNDILIVRQFPQVAMNGGDGRDTLVWDNGDREFDRATYGDDVLLWNAPEMVFAYGGAGLDVLIGNTGGDRIGVIGHQGRDVLVGGSGADNLDADLIGGWGNDWIVGGTGQD